MRARYLYAICTDRTSKARMFVTATVTRYLVSDVRVAVFVIGP